MLQIHIRHNETSLKQMKNPLSENELMRGCLTFAKQTKNTRAVSYIDI